MIDGVSIQFKRALTQTDGHEGGFSDDPRDPGNWTGGKVGVGVLAGTKRGISAAAFPDLVVKDLTDEQIDQMYYSRYWLPIKGDDLPAWLGPFLYDFAVNSGTGTAARALQRAVGATADGVIGPQTLAALSTAAPEYVLRRVFVERAMLFARNENRETYGAGWYGRLFDVAVNAVRRV